MEMRERVSWLLDRYSEPAMVEENLPGREFTVAIIGNNNEPEHFPSVEINSTLCRRGVNPIYPSKAKWIGMTALAAGDF